MSPTGATGLARRRLIVCCDRTWNTPDRYGHKTNVVRLVRSIKSFSTEGVSQIVYYHPGVGRGLSSITGSEERPALGYRKTSAAPTPSSLITIGTATRFFCLGSPAALTRPEASRGCLATSGYSASITWRISTTSGTTTGSRTRSGIRRKPLFWRTFPIAYTATS
jgi:hypothetical protein